jgi:hypothetical protein
MQVYACWAIAMFGTSSSWTYVVSAGPPVSIGACNPLSLASTSCLIRAMGRLMIGECGTNSSLTASLTLLVSPSCTSAVSGA